jgi:hypothetical protein
MSRVDEILSGVAGAAELEVIGHAAVRYRAPQNRASPTRFWIPSLGLSPAVVTRAHEPASAPRWNAPRQPYHVERES